MFTPRQIRRGLPGFVLAFVAVAVLVLLPSIGLLRIKQATDTSHQFTSQRNALSDLASELLVLVTGPLAVYGTTGLATDREAAVTAIRMTRTQVAAAEEWRTTGIRDDFGPLVETQVQLATEVLDSADSFVEEIDSGQTVESAPSTPRVVGAAGAILSQQHEFSLGANEVSRLLDAERRSAVREGEFLLGTAVILAVVIIGGLGILTWRGAHSETVRAREGRESAERLAAHRGDVVNMAAHELRNPLTALTLASELIVRSAANSTVAELEDLAQDAHVAALRCNSLVNELLDLGRMDAERLQLHAGTTPLQPALQAAVAMAEAHHGSRDVRISGRVETSVMADPDRLRVILRNLIDNAFKYSPSNSAVFISVVEGNERVRVEVLDEGAGVPEEFRERIFERFERLATPGHASGVGIGLFLSRELARRMNGELRCGPSDGGGQFELELPLGV
ncbi:MAG: sensor histidine kinase [Dehalococcoidia bacterium]